MATVTKRAACCNQATPARRTGQPAVGSRSSYSIARKKRRAKYLRRQITCLLLAAAALTALIYVVVGALTPDKPGTVTVVTPQPVIETQTPIQTPAAEPTPAPRFELSAAERDVVERVVMAEAGGESFEGQMLVAQCILNACEKTGTQPSEVVVTFKYAPARPDPTDSVREAVAAVFDAGEFITDEPVMFFYNPTKVTSTWHESQTCATSTASRGRSGVTWPRPTAASTSSRLSSLPTRCRRRLATSSSCTGSSDKQGQKPLRR